MATKTPKAPKKAKPASAKGTTATATPKRAPKAGKGSGTAAR